MNPKRFDETFRDKPPAPLKPGEIYLAISYLTELCLADDEEASEVFLIDMNPAARKRAAITELERIGAIELSEGKWVVTAKGREINTQLNDVLY